MHTWCLVCDMRNCPSVFLIPLSDIWHDTPPVLGLHNFQFMTDTVSLSWHDGMSRKLCILVLSFWWPCRGLHFLALQKDEEAEQCAGVWLLQDREPPSIWSILSLSLVSKWYHAVFDDCLGSMGFFQLDDAHELISLHAHVQGCLCCTAHAHVQGCLCFCYRKLNC